jgi:hypothetical protein
MVSWLKHDCCKAFGCVVSCGTQVMWGVEHYCFLHIEKMMSWCCFFVISGGWTAYSFLNTHVDWQFVTLRDTMLARLIASVFFIYMYEVLIAHPKFA